MNMASAKRRSEVFELGRLHVNDWSSNNIHGSATSQMAHLVDDRGTSVSIRIQGPAENMVTPGVIDRKDLTLTLSRPLEGKDPAECDTWIVWTPDGASPRVVHTSRFAAVTEAKRLASVHPGKRFYAMASIGFAESKAVEFTEHDPDPIPF